MTHGAHLVIDLTFTLRMVEERRTLSRWPKRCMCGRSYDESAWMTLPLVGTTTDGDIELEFRNCQCSSTISVEREHVSSTG